MRRLVYITLALSVLVATPFIICPRKCFWLADCHYHFYRSLTSVKDLKDKESLAFPVFMLEWRLYNWGVVHGVFNEQGELAEGAEQVLKVFSDNREYLTVEYIIDGQRLLFQSRFPWRDTNQKLYEAHFPESFIK